MLSLLGWTVLANQATAGAIAKTAADLCRACCDLACCAAGCCC